MDNFSEPLIETQIVLQTSDAGWELAHVEQSLAVLMPHITPLYQDETPCICTIVLSDDAHITPLNAAYRAKDAATNVLSFPSDAEDELGDVILAYETLCAEASEQGKALDAHVSHMMLHGILHLLGYDHENPEDAAVMEAQEIAILAELSIANPYD